METGDKEYIFCEDANNAILAYLDHANRKLKRDPDYEIHPIIRAINNALSEIGSCQGTIMAVSGSKMEEGLEPTEMYTAEVEKSGEIIKILEIKDLITGNILSIYDALIIIEFNLKLEKIKSDMLNAHAVESLLNETFKGTEFMIVCPDNFEEARDYFRDMLSQRKIHLPPDKGIKESLLEINATTPWEEYDPRVRRLIASFWSLREGKNGISLPSNEISKEEAIRLFKMLFTGEIRNLMLKICKERIK